MAPGGCWPESWASREMLSCVKTDFFPKLGLGEFSHPFLRACLQHPAQPPAPHSAAPASPESTGTTCPSWWVSEEQCLSQKGQRAFIKPVGAAGASGCSALENSFPSSLPLPSWGAKTATGWANVYLPTTPLGPWTSLASLCSPSRSSPSDRPGAGASPGPWPVDAPGGLPEACDQRSRAVGLVARAAAGQARPASTLRGGPPSGP